MISREDRRAFAAATAVLAARGSGRSAGGTAMRIYLALFIVAIVVTPAVRALILTLANPTMIGVMTAESTPVILCAGAFALLLTAACAGGARGAVVPRPSYIQFVVRSPLIRRLTLRRPLVVTQFLVAAGFTAATGVVCGALAVGGVTLTWLGVMVSLVVAAAYGVLLVAAWLSGQTFGRVRIGAGIGLVALLAALAVAALTGLWSRPAEWMRALPDTAASGTLAVGWAVGAIAIAVATVVASFALLGRLRSAELMVQGQSWASAGLLAQTGDVRGSLERVRMPARHTPRRVSLRSGPLMWLIVKRDATGAVRHPVRLSIGICSALLAGALGAIALSATTQPGAPGIGPFIGAIAGVLGYLSAGAFTDGVRAHADNIGAPALFGTAAQPLALLHLVFPAIASCIVMAVGAILAFASVHVAPIALIAAPVFALIMVALRGISAVKGPLPITLLLPVPTPVGDVSILFALAWSFDGVLIALAVGACVTLGVATSVPALAISAALLLAVFALWGRMRLQRLRA